MLNHSLNENCYVALIEKRHAKIYYEFIERNRENYKGILHFIEHIHTEKDTEEFILKTQIKMAEGTLCVWGIWEQKKIIGVVSARNIDEEFKSAEISYCIDKDNEGKGLISKACDLLIDYLFTEYNIERLELGCDVKNVRSQNIAKRFGFINEGIERKAFIADGKFIDCYRWSLLREEYFENKK